MDSRDSGSNPGGPTKIVFHIRVSRVKLGFSEKRRLPSTSARACDTAGIPELYTNAFMGHRNHLGQEYTELNKAKLELEYLRVEPFLMVYGQSKENLEIKEDIRKMETRIIDLNKEIAEQRTKNMELEKRVKVLSETLYPFIKNIDKFEGVQTHT